MKGLKSIVAALLIIIFSGSALSAQSDDYRFTVKTNPLNALAGPFWLIVVPLSGEYIALFEAKTFEKQSIQIGLSYVGPSPLLNLDDIVSTTGDVDVRTSGFRFQLMNKFFISRDLQAPAGFYLAPHFSYASMKIVDRDDRDNNLGATRMNINATLGYQIITAGGFALDIYTGLGFLQTGFSLSGDLFEEDEFDKASRINVPLGFTFGFAF